MNVAAERRGAQQAPEPAELSAEIGTENGQGIDDTRGEKGIKCYSSHKFLMGGKRFAKHVERNHLPIDYLRVRQGTRSNPRPALPAIRN